MVKNHTEYMREYSRKRAIARKQEAIAYLGGSCVRCSSTDDLHFDHIDPSTKLFNVTTAIASRAKAAFYAELDKCQLLCNNCHRAKTREDMGWQKIGTHGTLNTYTKLGCRCDACRLVWNEAARRHKRTYKNKLRQQREAIA